MKTPQEMFDVAAPFLLAQNAKSMATMRVADTNDLVTSQCAYRGDEGRKCAIGCLIPDELYEPDMEGRSAPFIIARLGWEGEDVRGFLKTLQRIHDEFDPERWPSLLREIAARYNLNTDCLETVKEN